MTVGCKPTTCYHARMARRAQEHRSERADNRLDEAARESGITATSSNGAAAPLIAAAAQTMFGKFFELPGCLEDPNLPQAHYFNPNIAKPVYLCARGAAQNSDGRLAQAV